MKHLYRQGCFCFFNVKEKTRLFRLIGQNETASHILLTNEQQQKLSDSKPSKELNST